MGTGRVQRLGSIDSDQQVYKSGEDNRQNRSQATEALSSINGNALDPTAPTVCCETL